MSKKLEGKIALITGGTSGIGLGTAKRFVAEGAKVYITGRRQAELDKAVAEIGSGVVGVQGDVSKSADIDRLYSLIQKDEGRLDVIFANAGGGKFAGLADVTEEQFDQEFAINVKGVVLTVQRALPLFTNGGSVILNASVAARKGMPNFSIYSAAKAAVRSFARTWTTDLKDRKIRVNSISPGVVVTPAYESLLGKEGIQGFIDYMSPQIPLGRTGTEDEIATAVVFLASDDSSYITGIDLVVDGGISQI